MIFDFPNHTVRTTYPASTTLVQFGKGWVFPIKPDAPDQKTFTLTMSGMTYYLNGISPLPDATINAQRNAMALVNFYQAVLQWDTFTYVHPVYGSVTCRFKNPLDIPTPTLGGSGVLPDFEITFIEVPA